MDFKAETTEQRLERLMRDARRDMHRLGHSERHIGIWIVDYMSGSVTTDAMRLTCHACGEYIVVEPFAHARAELRGPAAQFRCNRSKLVQLDLGV